MMFNSPEVILQLWMLPVLLLVTLPLLALIIWILFKFSRKVTGKTAILKKTTEPEEHNEKRFNTRVNIEDSKVYISDNMERISGKISNVSLSGICIYGLPEDKLHNSNKLFLRVQGESGAFSVLVKTKWQYVQQSGKIIGAKIENAPPGWSDFVAKATRSETLD